MKAFTIYDLMQFSNHRFLGFPSAFFEFTHWCQRGVNDGVINDVHSTPDRLMHKIFFLFRSREKWKRSISNIFKESTNLHPYTFVREKKTQKNLPQKKQKTLMEGGSTPNKLMVIIFHFFKAFETCTIALDFLGLSRIYQSSSSYVSKTKIVSQSRSPFSRSQFSCCLGGCVFFKFFE